jgi:hypothetical protein
MLDDKIIEIASHFNFLLLNNSIQKHMFNFSVIFNSRYILFKSKQNTICGN